MSSKNSANCEFLMNGLLDAVPELLFIADRDRNVIASNWHEHDFITKQQRQSKHKCYELFMQSDSPCKPCLSKEVFRSAKSIKKTGKTPADGRDREINAHPIRNDQGEVEMVAVHVRDITEKLRSDKHQRSLENRIQQAEKLESLGSLAGGIGHDFNNLLVSLIGNLSMAKEALENGDLDELRILLTEIDDAARHTTGLTRQLLTFTRGGLPVPSSVPLRDLMSRAVGFSLRGSNVEYCIEMADDLHAVNVDESQMYQVFSNLAINARQAMPNGGTLRIKAEETHLDDASMIPVDAGSYIRVIVSDEGCGIDESIRNRIFDPFFSTKQVGRGIGLASSHSIMRRHGGHIEIDPTPGLGASFVLHLPAVEKGKTPAQKTRPKVQFNTLGPVLIMDDEESVLTVAGRMLKYLGVSASFARTGEIAVELFSNAHREGKPFSAVILDLTVRGGMGGLQAVQEILKIEPNAIVFASSGYAENAVMAHSEEYGFCGSIPKPYTVTTLRHKLEKALFDSV